MKIFCVHNNYRSDTAESLFGTIGELVYYTLPDSAILRSGNPMFVPDFDSDFRAFPSIVYRIGKLGKGVAPRFAYRYLDAFSLAFNVVACQSLVKIRESALPWTPAVTFDRSCLLGNLQPIDALNDCGEITIKCNSDIMTYNHELAIAPIEDVLAMLTRDNTIKNGDLILSAIAPEGIPLHPGEHLDAFCPQPKINFIDINIR